MTRALSPSKAERLYWLGRYVQRALAVAPEAPQLVTADSPGSLTFNLGRAYENGFVLRDLLDNNVFSYLRLAQTKAESLEVGQWLKVREVHDSLYAFWGILDQVLPLEASALCRWGRFLELWDERTRQGDGQGAEDALVLLGRCWEDLGLEAPADLEAPVLESWFGRCYAPL